MTTIVTRAGKGSPLTHTEVDTNFTNLNTNKFETAAIPLGTLAAPSISFVGDANTGAYSPGADTLAFVTAGSNRVHITSAGLVGIGNSSPSTTLSVTGGISGTAGANISGAGWGVLPYVANSLAIDNNAGEARFFATGANATTKGSFVFYNGETDGGTAAAMVIDSSSRVGIGTASPGSLLHAAGKIRFGGNATYYGEIDHDSASTGSNIYDHSDSGGHIFKKNGTEQLQIDSSNRLLVGIIASPAHQLQVSTDSAGKPSTNTWTIVSDERIKEEIELADLDLCYQAVKNIPLKRFKWKDEVYTEEQVRDRRKLGWIAQDVEAVFPKAVGTYEFKYNQVFEETIIPAVEEVLDDEGNVTTPAQPERIEKGELISEDVIEDCRDLNSDQLYAAMYGAIQKLMVKVETLEAAVTALQQS